MNVIFDLILDEVMSPGCRDVPTLKVALVPSVRLVLMYIAMSHRDRRLCTSLSSSAFLFA